MYRQCSTPNWSSSFRSLTSAAALGVVMASVSPALAYGPASVSLDAVTAVEGYPVGRNYSYVAPSTNPHYFAGWNSVHLRSGSSTQKSHPRITVK